MCSHCTCPSIQICRTSMLVFESIRNTICALTVPAQAFKSAEHQCSSSRANFIESWWRKTSALARTLACTRSGSIFSEGRTRWRR